MKAKLFFFLLLLSFLFYKAIAQKNEFQLRYNYIGGRYFEQLIPMPDYLNTDIFSKINTHPFRYHESNSYFRSDDSYFSEHHYFKYYYLGLAYRRDSVMEKYFFRFRIDKFSYNHKYTLLDSDTLRSVTADCERTYSETNASRIQFTAGFGRTLKWKHLNFDLGLELPIYFKGDDEFHSFSSSRDSLGEHSSTSAYFYPGGIGVGLFLSGSLGFSFFKHYFIGIESSGGIIYFNSFGTKDFRFVMRYPTLTLAYKFGRLKR